jgi:integrase
MPRTPHPWYRRQTGWWMVQLNRKKVRLVKGPKDAATRKVARDKLRELLAVAKANPRSGPQTVASVIEKYLRHTAKAYSERSLYERRLLLQSFAELHGWRGVNDGDCIPYHVTEWLDAHPEWASDWTRQHAVAVVQRPFNWAARQRLIPANPFRGVTHHAGQPRRPLTDAEFHKLLRAAARGRTFHPTPSKKKLYPSDIRRRQRPSAGARFRQLLVFLRFTGARPGEAARLRWEHIDLEAQVIRIPRHKTSRTQQVKKPRVIPLHPVVVKLLAYVRRLNQPGDVVFLNHRKTPWNRSSLSLRIRRARAAGGIPDDAKLYGLRHRFGTAAVVNGVDIKTLAELMGHETTRMTEHYLHLAGQKEHLADAMRRANGRSRAS